MRRKRVEQVLKFDHSSNKKAFKRKRITLSLPNCAL